MKSVFHEEVRPNLFCNGFNGNGCKDAFCRFRHRCFICGKGHSVMDSTRCRWEIQGLSPRALICENFNERGCNNTDCPLLHICVHCRTHHSIQDYQHAYDRNFLTCRSYNLSGCRFKYCTKRHVCECCFESHSAQQNDFCARFFEQYVVRDI